MNDPLHSPGLHLVHGQRGEYALDALAEALRRVVRDPFDMVPLCVPDAGTQRWASQGLARRLGVCAGVTMTTLGRVLGTVCAELTGIRPEEDPWRADRLLWSTLAVMDEARGQEWSRVMLAHVPEPGTQDQPGRRLHAARRASTLLLRYARLAPDLVRAWEEGADVDVSGEPLDPATRWQPQLWRELCARVEGPSPLERHDMTIEALAAGEGEVGPLLVLDPPAIGPLEQELLFALRDRTAIHVITLTGPRNPTSTLVERLGRHDAVILRQWRKVASKEVIPALGAAATGTATSLAHLQAAVRGEAPVGVVESEDRSVEWHLSHGPDRQVEVLRDALLRAFERDRTLEPREVVVLCPDLAMYAPHLVASFGTGAGGASQPAGRLRLAVAEPSLRQLNPVLATLPMLIDLATTRADVSALLNLCSHAPVARRFGLTDADRVAELSQRAGIRWGLDLRQRQDHGVGALRQSTWFAGIDRMVAGVALDEEDLTGLGHVLPLDDISSNDADLVGRLTELVVRVHAFVSMCRESRPAAEWAQRLREAIDGFCEVPGDEEWQITHAHEVLADLADSTPVDAPAIGVGDVRVLLSDLMAGREPRVGHGSGALVVCQPGQLTHVPHRIVALLGMDTGRFPHPQSADGDDLTAHMPEAMDLTARARDRATVLAAVMNATERLLVVHQGRDPRSNAKTPMPVVLAELRSALVTAGGTTTLERQTSQHRLQPFAPEEFMPDRLGVGSELLPEPSFDAAALAGARALVSPRHDPEPIFGTQPLPAVRFSDVEVAELSRFLQHPVRTYLRVRGGLRTFVTEPPPNDLPIELDSKAQWPLGTRVLGLVERGMEVQQALDAEWLRGDVPPRRLGASVITQLQRELDPLVTAAAALPGERVPHDLSHVVTTSDGPVRVRGRVITRGHDIVDLSYSRPRAKHLVDGWVQLLALTTAEPGSWRWRMIGRRSEVVLGPIPGHFSVERGLADLVELYALGLREPLPLPVSVAHAFASAALDGRDTTDPNVLNHVRAAYYDPRHGWGDRDDLWARYWPTPDELLAERARPGEGRPHEPSRLGALALRVWSPLLQVMNMGGR